MFPDCKKYWNQKDFGLEVINLGSSSAKYGFNYSGLSIKAANWPMAPQTFVGDLAILQNYCSYLKPHAIVIIPLCPFSSLGGGNDDLPDKYYTIVRPISIPHASLKRRDAIENIVQQPFFYFPLVGIVSEIKFLFCKKKNRTVTDFDTDANNWITSWMKEFSLYNLHNPLALITQDRFNDSGKAMKDLLLFCSEHEYEPVIVIPPMSKHLFSKLDELFRNQFIYEFIQKANIIGAPVLDYMEHSELSEDVNFCNAYLLNETGAKLFTKEVLKDLRVSK
jgi:hypothetical protein